jgi:hypothetical protein
MRRALTILGICLLLVGGVTAAVALGAAGSSRAGSTSTGAAGPAAKVWLCHHTGSWKHPYHLIHVSSHAAAAHRRHGDVDPGAGNSCPTSQPAGAKPHGANGAPGNSGKGKSKAGSEGDAADKNDATGD